MTSPRIIRYKLPGDWTLLVGTSDVANDKLSLEIASPDDWWFHADGVSGAHAVLCARAGEEPTRTILRRAAAIAAYHSKARTAYTARVYCTRARYVLKARGTKLGTVHVSRGELLRVRPRAHRGTRVRISD
jgi:predicted ribosome quality control (RQC) complex YloA/Tae2 family protein